MNDFVIYTVITCMYDCMDFGTPILFKYNLLKEIICTLDNISLIYFFTIIFFFIFSVVSLCVFAQRLLKKFDFDFDYLLFWGDQFIPLDFMPYKYDYFKVWLHLSYYSNLAVLIFNY